MRKKFNLGFTLLELIIVIVIIGLLSAIAIPKFFSLRKEAEKAQVQELVRGLQSASNLFLAKLVSCNLNYPDPGNFTFSEFVQAGGQAQEMQCDGPWKTFAIEDVRNHLAANPDYPIVYGNQIIINTKTGRTVTITQDSTSHGITWTASPTY